MPRRRRDGSTFWADLTLTPLTDQHGTHTHWVAIQRDVTHERAEAEEQRQHERTILANAQRLGTMTEQLTRTQHIAKLGNWRRALGSDEMDWSDLVYPMFGVTRETFRPTISSVWDLVHPDDHPLLGELIEKMERDGTGYHCVYRTIGPDREVRHIWTDCMAECDERGQVIAVTGIVQDITAQKQAQAMVLHAEKLRSIGQLTGGIAHDFNNLLTVISINLEMMGDMIVPGDPAEELCAMALQAADSGTQLTSSLLAFARRQPLEPKAADVNQTLAEIRLLATHSIGERHPIVLQTQPDLPLCQLDRAGFESAILNLLVNSRDAMPDGGAITIKTTLRRVRSRSGDGRGPLAAGDYVVISVADTGIGMSLDVQEQAFEPFFTTKPIGKGTGLGLSTVIGFARQSGGDVELTSSAGHGTSVRVLLPAQT